MSSSALRLEGGEMIEGRGRDGEEERGEEDGHTEMGGREYYMMMMEE
jgi:hypothetical protein